MLLSQLTYYVIILGYGGGEFFQVESFSGEVFQVDTENMKKKLRSSGEVFQVGGGNLFKFSEEYTPLND